MITYLITAWYLNVNLFDNWYLNDKCHIENQK